MDRKKLKTALLIFVLLAAAVIGPSKVPEKVTLDGPYSSYDKPLPTEETGPFIPPKEAIKFEKFQLEVRGNPQVVYMLELDLKNPDLRVFSVLAQDRIFGFEILSEMGKRYNATAVVNAGFNYAYGQPSGLVVQNGKILSGSIGNGRILLIKNSEAWFQESEFKIWLDADGVKYPVDRVNPYPEVPGILVFTPEFGPTDRIGKKHSFCMVENNRVVSAGIANDEMDIPKDGFLIADLRTDQSPLTDFQAGQRVELLCEVEVDQGYQCSGALVKDGVNVAKNEDPWVGNLAIPAPRTAVGLKDKNTLVFLVVDGRQPGYSIGVTGRELADILISLGVTEAAILDGGASSEMIYKNEIVNKPSTGRERLLASGFVIY